MRTHPTRIRTGAAILSLATAGVVAVLAACARDSVTPSETRVPTTPRRDVTTAPAFFHSNAEHYSDKGAKPATGRSGSASLQTRALLAKDGTTLVEATTGQLDGAAGPGQLAKTQLKTFDAAGDAIVTKNFNGLTSSYWAYTAKGLLDHDPLQVQANVRGIDPKRTDVVTLQTKVMKRPDLTVGPVSNPAKVFTNQNVAINAVVSEINGDVGGTATCTLYVDGTQVDDIQGMWVDAGSSVTCAFTTQFATVGTHALRVAVSHVVPGDWDTSNNDATGSIKVVPPIVDLDWTASASETNSTTNVTFDRNFNNCAYYYGLCSKDSTGTNTTTNHSSTFNIAGSTSQGAATFPVSINFGASTSGNAIATLLSEGITAPDGGCATLFETSSGMHAQICSSQNANTTSVQFWQAAGVATYYSHGYTTNYYRNAYYQYECHTTGWWGTTQCSWVYVGDQYSSNSYYWSSGASPTSLNSGDGGVFTLTGDFGFDLTLTDSFGQKYVAGGTVPVTSSTTSSSTPTSCTTAYDYYTYQDCRSSSTTTTVNSASGSGTGKAN